MEWVVVVGGGGHVAISQSHLILIGGLIVLVVSRPIIDRWPVAAAVL